MQVRPQGEKKIGVIFIGVSCKCTPMRRKKSIFEEIFAGRVGLEGGSGSSSSFSLCIEGDDYNIVINFINFLRKKCTPEKILSTPMKVGTFDLHL